jgi:hypothetical protein
MHCSLLGRHVGKEGRREDKLEEMEAIVCLLIYCSFFGRLVGKERRREDKLEEKAAMVSFLKHCPLLGRHVGKEGGREDMLEELESIATFPSFEWNAAFLAGMPEERGEGRIFWRIWNWNIASFPYFE